MEKINSATANEDFSFLYINSDQESDRYRDIVRQSVEWSEHVLEDGTCALNCRAMPRA